MVSFNARKDARGYQSVADFYAGKSVFITGGTGFLGKVFIEKLLYCCPQIDKIYILIREKKNTSIEKRIEELTNSPLFDRLKGKRPQDLKKIISIIGDITEPDLGINNYDEQILLDKVSIVIHSAATIKFNESLKTSMAINFEGTVKIIELCKRMKNIEVLVHVSTAYANTDKETLDEVVYPPPAKLSDVYKFIEKYGDNEELTMKFINGRPNTYTFTKALTESYVNENHGNIPTVIVRPSMVTPSYYEPEGWTDNWNGPTSLITFVGKGIMRVVAGKATTIPDFIPVDYVANLSVVAAAKCQGLNDVTVYNCCSSSANPITLGTFEKYLVEDSVKNNFNVLPYPWVLFTTSKLILTIFSFLLETLPAYIGDLLRLVRGKTPRYMKIKGHANTIRNVMYYFTSNTWIMHSDRVQKLSTSLSIADQELFPFNPTTINWKRYIPNYCYGVRRYLLNVKK